MKTNKIFKNLLSLLTLGLVVFSCNKPSEDPKADQNSKALELVVASVKFEKAKNLNNGKTEVSEFYEKLFITKTPARTKGKDVAADATNNGYPTEFTTVAADIVGDSIINVNLPFNSKFSSLTAEATVTAKITFKSAVDGVSLEGFNTPIKGDSAEITFKVAVKDLTKKALEDASTKQVLKFSKEGFADKIYTVNFKFSQTKSTKSVLATNTDGTKLAALAFNHNATSGQPNEKIKNGTTTSPVNPAKASSAGAGTKESPYAFTMTKNAELANETISSWKFKVDVLTLPEGAFIDVTAANFSTSSHTNHTVKDPTTEFAISAADHGIQFRVVAQDGTTATYYKLTFKES
ncbi:hypothetical protein [Ichthyobacterium seriolicida]|uniref:Lipoprotein n=1 Tax=Ichthyobacterium seriolicida TaxID=242600 RepID=A0A1J1DXX8_9FLAO|nr:hypothetical protein [Ichthyobacterium seriolicida]BAV94735.1 hypothetical protein JBKA6_0722 [Ichthyobacterium seriolicida]